MKKVIEEMTENELKFMLNDFLQSALYFLVKEQAPFVSMLKRHEFVDAWIESYFSEEIVDE